MPLHLKAKGEGWKRRRMAAAILAAAVDRMINKYGVDRDWVIGGDYNAPLASDDFSKLITGGMVPLSAGDEEGGAFSYVKGPQSMIDHIFLSPTLAQTHGADDFFIVAHDKEIPDSVLLQRDALIVASGMLNDVCHVPFFDNEEVAMERHLPELLAGCTVDPYEGEIEAVRRRTGNEETIRFDAETFDR